MKNRILVRSLSGKLDGKCYSDVIHSFNWKSAIEHDGGF